MATTNETHCHICDERYDGYASDDEGPVCRACIQADDDGPLAMRIREEMGERSRFRRRAVERAGTWPDGTVVRITPPGSRYSSPDEFTGRVCTVVGYANDGFYLLAEGVHGRIDGLNWDLDMHEQRLERLAPASR